jgi:hypothetical protein
MAEQISTEKKLVRANKLAKAKKLEEIAAK